VSATARGTPGRGGGDRPSGPTAGPEGPGGPAPAGQPQPGPADRLARQVEFLLEVDRLKSVLRRGYLADGSRHENSAEHSWTVALMAVLLAEHASEPVDVLHVVRMLLVHDIVEIDAGDTYVYDEAGKAAQAEREALAADRIFALLPTGQATEVRALWDEFEQGRTPEARFARALDRFAGFLLNHASDGRSWRENGVTVDKVLARNAHIGDGAPSLWQLVQRLIDDAAARGWLPPPGRDPGGATPG